MWGVQGGLEPGLPWGRKRVRVCTPMTKFDPSEKAAPRKRRRKGNRRANRPSAAAQQGRPSQRRRPANTGKKRRDMRPASDQHGDRNPQRIPYERGVEGDSLVSMIAL